MDFFTVPTLTGRVLFVCVLLCHHRRRIVHLNITPHPTAEWSAQQVVDAFPDDTAPRWIHRDRDRVYGAAFQRRVAGMGIAEVVSAPASPWQNPYVERVIGSIRRECLDHVVVWHEAHLRHVLGSYLRYCHRSRTHLGLQKDTSDRRPTAAASGGPIVVIPESAVSITATNDAPRERSSGVRGHWLTLSTPVSRGARSSTTGAGTEPVPDDRRMNQGEMRIEAVHEWVQNDSNRGPRAVRQSDGNVVGAMI
jgi:transposase InsO family protein